MSAICRGLVLAAIVVENKESLNNPSNNPNKSGAVTLSEFFLRILTRYYRKIVGLASDQSKAVGDNICERLFC